MNLFASTARWIWDDTVPGAIEHYDLRARREFFIDHALFDEICLHGWARLRITAESYYSASLPMLILYHFW